TLLSEHLKQRLQLELVDEVATLHRRASLWYAAQESWTEAVQHAIAAGDIDRALAWIRNCAMTLVKKGELFTLLGWQRHFPPKLMRSQPEVRLAIAWGLALALRFDEALRLLTDVEQDAGTNRPPVEDTLSCECQAIRSVAVALQDDS